MKRVVASCFLIAVIVPGLIPMSGADAAAIPDAETLRPLGLELNWTAQAVINRERDVIRHVTNDEENVYVQSSAGTVTVLDADTGRRMWARQLGRNDEFSFQAASNADLLFVTTGPVVRAVNKFTGEEVFEYRLPNQPASAPLVGDDSFYIPQSGGSVYCYSIDVLEYLQRYETLPPRTAQKYVWRFISNDKVDFPPVMSGDEICFVSHMKNLHSLSGAGKSNFQIFLNARPSAPLAVDSFSDEPQVIVATENDELFSYEAVNGTRVWNFPLERSVSKKPFVHKDRVYVVMDRTGLTAISTKTGRNIAVPIAGGDGSITQRWFVPGIETVTAVTDEYIFAIDEHQRLIAIRHDDASCTAMVQVSDYAVPHSNEATDRLLLVSSAGELVCLKPIGTEFATYHRRRDRQPLDVDVPENDGQAADSADVSPEPQDPEE